MGYIKRIKSIFDLRDVKDDSFDGKDGYVLKVDEPNKKMGLVPYLAGAPITLPENQIRVSFDWGDDGTGEMGSFDKAFKTIFGAANHARGLITGDPTLKDKILINVEQGEYLDENDILFDGWINCQEGVNISVGVGVALFAAHGSGEKFRITGFPNITGQVGGGLWINANTDIIFSFYGEFDKVISPVNTAYYCEEIYLNIKYIDFTGSGGDVFNGIYININMDYLIMSTYFGVYFIEKVLSTNEHIANINVNYLDNTSGGMLYGFLISGWTDTYDTVSNIHIEGGDSSYITPLEDFNSLFLLLQPTTRSNILNISSNGLNYPRLATDFGFGLDPNSKEITFSGIWNCYDIAFNNIKSLTFKDLTINSINDNPTMTTLTSADVDVIGSLTMVTDALPKYDAAVTLTYISDLPGGGSGSTYFLEQVAHGFLFGDIVSNTIISGWVKADQSLLLPADGIVINVVDVDKCTIQLNGLLQDDALSLIKGADYYLGDNGTYTTEYLENAQYLFTATEADEISLDVEDMFVQIIEFPEESESFVIRVDMPVDGEAVILPFLIGDVINAEVDWGDTTTSSINAWDDPNIIHIYTLAGIYDIKITGTMSGFGNSLGNNIKNYSIEIISWGLTGLDRILLQYFNYIKIIPTDVLGSFSNISDFNYSFFNLPITYIPDGLFKHAINATAFIQTFTSCDNLVYIPNNIFNDCPSAADFTSTFRYCRSLIIIPNIFSKNINVVSFADVFSWCDSLQTVYTDLFINNDLVEDYNGVFWNCSSLTNIPSFAPINNSIGVSYYSSFSGCTLLTGQIPSSMFPPNAINYQSTFSGCNILNGNIPIEIFDCNNVTNFSSMFKGCYDISFIPAGSFNCPNLTSVYGMFWDCQDLTGTVPIFDTPLITSFDYTFYACYSLEFLQNGTFDSCVNVTIFYRVFTYCRSLQSIPSNIFDNNPLVTDFVETFYGFSLTEIPTGLFDNNTLVTTFTDCFGGWNNLTTIPSTLFDNCPLVENFSLTFRHSPITSIPTGLFDNNPNVTNFYGTFAYCRLLTTLPNTIFASCPLVDSFAETFYLNESLATISSDLFDFNVNVTSFYGTFPGNALTSIPAGLFDNNPLVTTFAGVFSWSYSLITIPSTLFDNNPLVTTFYNSFEQCTSLITIPAGLFDNNPLVTTFAAAFDNCTYLASIPLTIFDNKPLIISFMWTFRNCINLTGAAPELWLDYPGVSGSDCFLNDTGLSNYADIPADWK